MSATAANPNAGKLTRKRSFHDVDKSPIFKQNLGQTANTGLTGDFAYFEIGDEHRRKRSNVSADDITDLNEHVAHSTDRSVILSTDNYTEDSAVDEVDQAPMSLQPFGISISVPTEKKSGFCTPPNISPINVPKTPSTTPYSQDPTELNYPDLTNLRKLSQELREDLESDAGDTHKDSDMIFQNLLNSQSGAKDGPVGGASTILSQSGARVGAIGGASSNLNLSAMDTDAPFEPTGDFTSSTSNAASSLNQSAMDTDGNVFSSPDSRPKPDQRIFAENETSDTSAGKPLEDSTTSSSNSANTTNVKGASTAEEKMETSVDELNTSMINMNVSGNKSPCGDKNTMDVSLGHGFPTPDKLVDPTNKRARRPSSSMCETFDHETLPPAHSHDVHQVAAAHPTAPPSDTENCQHQNETTPPNNKSKERKVINSYVIQFMSSSSFLTGKSLLSLSTPTHSG